jgi:hypothetical protein
MLKAKGLVPGGNGRGRLRLTEAAIRLRRGFRSALKLRRDEWQRTYGKSQMANGKFGQNPPEPPARICT